MSKRPRRAEVHEVKHTPPSATSSVPTPTTSRGKARCGGHPEITPADQERRIDPRRWSNPGARGLLRREESVSNDDSTERLTRIERQ